MRFNCLIIIAITFNLTFATIACAQELSYAQIEYNDIAYATAEEYAQIYQLINCFKIYSNYFNNTYTLGRKIISNHGNTKNEGLVYLQQGFNEEISCRIMDYYTTWDNELQKQVILSQEGIPIFGVTDINRCAFNIENGRITLQVRYYDSYELGDKHTYYITAHNGEGRWLINDLQWIDQ